MSNLEQPQPGPTMADPPTDFLKGTLDLMILKTLSWAPTHGYGIARWIEDCTDDTLPSRKDRCILPSTGSRSAG